MSTFKVIQGKRKEKPDFYPIYNRMFMNAIGEAQQQLETTGTYNLDINRKIVLSGVKMINAENRENMSYEYLLNRFKLIDCIKTIASQLTPNEFQTVFPIEKTYNGEKFRWKDYLYTKNSIEEMGADVPIGENMDDFFWDYQNWEIGEFIVNSMSVVSDIRRAEGKKGLMEEFFEDKGVPTYILNKDQKGKGFLTNNSTGETVEIKKSYPSYLKPL